jgi:hypothetical protein
MVGWDQTTLVIPLTYLRGAPNRLLPDLRNRLPYHLKRRLHPLMSLASMPDNAPDPVTHLMNQQDLQVLQIEDAGVHHLTTEVF